MLFRSEIAYALSQAEDNFYGISVETVGSSKTTKLFSYTPRTTLITTLLRLQDEDANAFTYLYDKNIFNDVNYIFNKEILFEICMPMIENAIAGQPGGITSFDEYSNWMDGTEFGADVVLGDRKSYPPSRCYYHFKRRKRTPRCVPETLRFSLHCISRQGTYG